MQIRARVPWGASVIIATLAVSLISLAVLMPGAEAIAQDQVIAGKPIITDADTLGPRAGPEEIEQCAKAYSAFWRRLPSLLASVSTGPTRI